MTDVKGMMIMFL